MNFCIDLTPLTKNPSGVGLYSLNLARALASLQEEYGFDLSIFYQPRLKNWLCADLAMPNCLSSQLDTGLQKQVFPLPVRLSNSLVKYNPNLLEWMLSRMDEVPDILHGTNYSVPPWAGCKKVLTIYDLSFIKYPTFSDAVSVNFSQQIRRYLKYTDLIITISESSKRDIIEYFEVPPNAIAVTYLASRYASRENVSVPTQSVTHNISQYSQHPYILFVGTLEPRKNIPALIQAFNILKGKYKISHNLLLAGRKGWKYQSIFEAINNSPWKESIHYLNYLSDEVILDLYAHAEVFVYPSFYEGFGLPVLEAMALGSPVVTSNTSSLPEVVGEAAILISPDNVDELVSAILKIVDNPSTRQALIEKGYLQSAKFSWRRTAESTLQAYKSIL